MVFSYNGNTTFKSLTVDRHFLPSEAEKTCDMGILSLKYTTAAFCFSSFLLLTQMLIVLSKVILLEETPNMQNKP